MLGITPRLVRDSKCFCGVERQLIGTSEEAEAKPPSKNRSKMTKQLEASCRIAAALDWSCYSDSACLAFGLSFRHVANVSSGDVETLVSQY
ncbi:hypothetical protein F443_15211 [Phytophthora nicotianae P1569]|uniref:Uncharacterized protein n=2 Tax=Phytophthora nicotianae TaxID=4792 RepID=V9EL06_PHYNI|nr:hypothetical protein F443_15211 [Phytophthora nicotianae P1569]